MKLRTLYSVILIIAVFIPVACGAGADGPEQQAQFSANAKLDPICGMTVTPEKAAAKSDYNKETYYFCSGHCKESFEKEPGKYVNSGEKSTSNGEHS